LFSELSIHYDMFQLTWPPSGNMQYVQNSREDIWNMEF